MGRTAGAKNRSPRELRAEAMRLLEKAAYIEKMDELKKEAAKAKTQAKAKAKRKGR